MICFKFKETFFLLYAHGCSSGMYVYAPHVCLVTEETEEDIGSPGTEVTESCKTPHGFWEEKLSFPGRTIDALNL